MDEIDFMNEFIGMNDEIMNILADLDWSGHTSTQLFQLALGFIGISKPLIKDVQTKEIIKLFCKNLKLIITKPNDYLNESNIVQNKLNILIGNWKINNEFWQTNGFWEGASTIEIIDASTASFQIMKEDMFTHLQWSLNESYALIQSTYENITSDKRQTYIDSIKWLLSKYEMKGRFMICPQCNLYKMHTNKKICNHCEIEKRVCKKCGRLNHIEIINTDMFCDECVKEKQFIATQKPLFCSKCNTTFEYPYMHVLFNTKENTWKCPICIQKTGQISNEDMNCIVIVSVIIGIIAFFFSIIG